MSLKLFITNSAIKLWWWSSWYVRFLGNFLGIETPGMLKNSGGLGYFDQILLVQVSMFLSVETVHCPLLSGNAYLQNVWYKYMMN